MKKVIKYISKIWFRYVERTGIIYILILDLTWLLFIYFVIYFVYSFKGKLLDIPHFLNILVFIIVFIIMLFVTFFLMKRFTTNFNEYINQYYDLTLWQERNIKYIITILNKNGDAEIERIAETINVSDNIQNCKIVKIYGSDNGMNFKDLRFESHIKNDKAHSLNYEILEDRPYIKVIKIIFPKGVRSFEKTVYYYKYYWKKLFSNQEEWFEGIDPSKFVEYVFISNYPLINFKVEEINRENRTIKSLLAVPKQEEIGEKNKKYKYVLNYKKRYKYNNTKISWRFGDNSGT